MKHLYLLLALLSVSICGRSQNVYGSMENWHNYSVGFPPAILEAPQGWHCPDSLIFTYGPAVTFSGNFYRQLFKTTDAHSGSFAARIVTREQDTFGVVPGLMTNADIGIDLDNIDFSNPMASIILSGGTPVSQKIAKMSAWIKYQPKGINDRAQLGIQAIASINGNDSVVGMGVLLVDQAVNSYTLKEVPVTYLPTAPTPYKVIIGFFSSIIANASVPADSSTLYVDDVTITNTTGVQEVIFGEKVYCTVDPVTHRIHLNTAYAQPLHFEVYGSNGQRVYATDFVQKAALAYDWASGVYAFRITDDKGRVVRKDKLLIP